MASIATIQTTQDRISLESGAKGSFSFTCTNIFGSAMLMAAQFSGDDANTEKWISIVEPIEREIGDQATDTYIVNIDIPKDAKAGEYIFSLLMYSVENPSLDFSQSDKVVVNVLVKETEPELEKFKMKWWMWLIIGVVVLGIIGGVIALLYDPAPPLKEDPCNVHWTEKSLSCDL